MENVTICSFNVENLFVRYKVFEFLPGEHTVRYVNDVRPTTLSGAANTNHADITYSLNVK
jgi:hypothetical protein